MSLDKCIACLAGFVSGLVLSSIFVAIQALIFYLTNKLVAADMLFTTVIAWILDAVNACFFIFVLFVCCASIRKNKKLGVKVANITLVTLWAISFYWWIFM